MPHRLSKRPHLPRDEVAPLGPRQGSPTDIVFGALAGVVATGAMTLVMDALYRRLPSVDQYPLPPREITESLIDLKKQEWYPLLTMLAHFGFGAAVVAGFARTRQKSGPLQGAVCSESVSGSAVISAGFPYCTSCVRPSRTRLGAHS